MSKFLPIDMEDPMSTLCRMVLETQYEDLPDNVINYAKRSILDTIGVIIGGSAMEGIPAVVNLVKDRGGKPESIIPFYGGKVPASEAALCIGPMARAMDFGDVHEEAGHSSEYTVPALLAATGLKDKVTGKEFITAYVVGQEVMIRIGMAFKAISRGTDYARLHGSSIFGVVAAIGKLLGLTQEELENAEGIASAMTQPHITTMYHPVTLILRVHHGFICQDAVNACLLARRGITGPRKEVLAAPSGYLGFAKWETDPTILTKALGEEWEMMGSMMKRFASRKPTHAVIDGLLDLTRENRFKADDIANIDVDVSSADPLSLSPSREAQWNPQTVHECQFSLPYVVATAAYDGDIFLDSYTPEARARQNVRDLMTRITIKEDPRLPTWGARVNTTLNSGKKYSRECIYPKGHPKLPFTEQELIDKFKRCVHYSACKLSETVVDSVITSLLNLERVDDVVNTLLVPLMPE
ncbi:MmgE/PrpD family protein [Thermodesulfobacteriota bacterium]